MRGLLVHGWAFCPRIFGPLVQQLEMRTPGWEWESHDFGFCGEPSLPTGHFDLAIGHSFGLMWLLHQTQVTFEKLVSIAGFSRFFSGRKFRAGTHPRLISRMQLQLKTEAKDVLKRFWSQCGSPGNDFELSCQNPNSERLNWALDALKSWDRQEQWSQLELCSDSRLVVAGTGDPIVPAELTTACFGDTPIHWVDSDSHLLPLVNPQRCALLIHNLISN